MTVPSYPFDDLLDGRPEVERARITDEAVSALLDGELEAFATDVGLEPNEIRQRLDDWPGFDARRAELESARDSLRSGILPATLDELTRHRLLAAAAASTATPIVPPVGPRQSSPRRGRWLALTAAAAAAVVVAVGVGAAVVSTRDGGSDSKSAATSARAVGYVGDLGDVTDPNTLRDEVGARLGGGVGAAASPQTTTTTPAASTPQLATDEGRAAGISSASTPSSPPGDSVAGTKADAERCAATIVTQAAPGSSVLLTATGVYRGQPAAIVTIERGTRAVTFIASLASCEVVGGQTGGSG